MKALAALVLAAPLFADVPRMGPPAELPVWVDPGDVPVPTWARSVVPSRAESAFYAEPGKIELRRGSAQPGARLPLFATRRGPGCSGRWLNVGPLAWMCSDVGDFSADEPGTPALGTRPWIAEGEDLARPHRPGARALPPIEPVSASDDGLPYRYYFAGRDGAYGFQNLQTALDDSPEQDLEPGFAVALLEEATAHGQKWGRTKKGRWVAMRELSPARPNLFHGELLKEETNVGWVVNDKVSAFTSEKLDKASGLRVRFEKVVIEEEKGSALRVGDGVWLRAKDVARVRLVAPPPEVTGEDERWIDVDLAQQTLIAYVGKTPVFATIVSTGKGPAPDFVTHPGTFRIWVKIFTTKMDNLDKEEADRHYAIEDVPWVQFFDKAIALHGAFWHREFGHLHSHGCVNLAPLDARWLFAFTSPHLPQGWSAVLPTKIEQGAVVRVR
ncbi:MAG: L,D-transpeptidase [Labilithrix sp.]|nr:L,D-transpeptidase [Labilithrix sp.]MCW5811178.1 L,D-transpeptidase [Labilithrix sp.]